VSVRGHRYWLTLVDDHTRHGWSIPLHTKDQAKTHIIEWVTAAQRQTGCQLIRFKCDRGSEFVNAALKDYFRASGVQLDLANPYSPEQNGRAEARNKTVSTLLRALLLQSEAPKSLWCYGLAHANHLANLLPHIMLGGVTPAEAWTGVKPSLTKLKVWGCTAHTLLSSAEKRKARGQAWA